MEYFNPNTEIKQARKINRIIMTIGYIAAMVLWVLWLNRIFGVNEDRPSANIDALIYLPALFGTPLIALLFVPPFVWIGGIWQTSRLKKALDESSFVIWLHTQPIFSLILSAISLIVYLMVCVIGLFFVVG